jgi:serine/threonine-protein kinase RsbW
MPAAESLWLRLEFCSSIGMVDLVETITHDIGRSIGLDDDGLHWTGLAVRESVINAIRHGNRDDRSKKVLVEFSTVAGPRAALTISIRDEGEGFDPSEVADPRAAENLLNAGGRGILMIRSFMDDVHIGRCPGGMEIRMTKRAPAESVGLPGDRS